MPGVWPVMKKEAREIRRDRHTLGIARTLPLLLLFLFAYGLSLDVDHIPTAILDLDRSPESVRYVDRFTHTRSFDVVAVVFRYEEIQRLMDAGRINVAIAIPPDFARHLGSQHPAPVQVILDGSYPPSARVAMAYVEAVNRVASGELAATVMARTGTGLVLPIAVEPRVWYNPALVSKDFLVPGLFGVILLAFPPLLSTLAIVREKENGSIQQIFVSPLRPYEFIIGKLLLYAAIAFVELLLGAGSSGSACRSGAASCSSSASRPSTWWPRWASACSSRRSPGARSSRCWPR